MNEVILDENDMKNLKTVKKIQTVYNEIGLNLSKLKDELLDFADKVNRGIAKKYAINIKEYTFNEVDKKLYNNGANCDKIFNSRLLLHNIKEDEFKLIISKQFKSLYFDICTMYNEYEKDGAFK